MPSLSVETHADGDVMRIALEGELDLATVPELERAIDEARARGVDEIVVDLRALAFLDSSGLRSLVMADARAADEGWAFALVPGADPVHRVFEITRMAERLRFLERPG